MCLLGIDCDLVVYTAAFAAQHVFYRLHPKGQEPTEANLIEEFVSHKDMKVKVEKEFKKTLEDFTVEKRTEVKELPLAKSICDSIYNKIIAATGGTEMISYLSDSKNFRHRVATTTPYKVRTQEKPVHYAALKEYVIQKYHAIVVEDLEADDALAQLSREANDSDVPFILVSVDKDLNQVPGLHYNFKSGKLYNVTALDGMRWLFKQMLTGDATDSIPGLPRIGEKNALVLMIDKLTTEKEMVSHVRQTYKANQDKLESPWKDYLNEQANLVYIRSNPQEGITL